MESVKCIAVDWSGEKKEGGQLARIWGCYSPIGVPSFVSRMA